MLHTPEELAHAIKQVAITVGYVMMFVAVVSLLVFVLAFKEAHAAEEPSDIDKAAIKVWVMHHRECEVAIKSEAPNRHEAIKHTAVYYKCVSLTYDRASQQMMDLYHANPEVEL